MKYREIIGAARTSLLQPGALGSPTLDTETSPPMNALKSLRLSAGLTQSVLAEQTGINIRQIQKLESGEIAVENITLKNAVAFADALGVSDIRTLLPTKK